MSEMNERLARQMLAAAQTDLDGMAAERDRLTRMRNDCQEWLAAHGYGSEMEAVTLSRPKQSTVSFPDAVRQILSEANGRALHRRVIADRAVELGVSTNATNIMPVVDTALRRLRRKGEAENTGEGYWRVPVPRPAPAPVHREDVSAPREPAVTPYVPNAGFRPFLNGERQPAF